MAVNMSNVKQIMHNNKEVIKIEDSSGHIIGQKKITTTTTITGTGRDILNKVYTVPDPTSNTHTLTFVSQQKFKNAIATQLGISSSDIISISDYQGQNYGGNGVSGNNSTSTVMGKTSDSSNGQDGFSKTDNRTSSSSTPYTFTITKTPSGGSTLYAWFKYTIGSYNYGPNDCSGSNVTYPERAELSSWKFSFTVTYNK